MTDLERMRAEYAERAQRLDKGELYSHFNRSYLFTIQQRQRDLLDMLRRRGIASLHGRHILELGCGSGGVLLEYLTFGARAKALVGIDILSERLLEGRHRFPGLRLTHADGQKLPFAQAQFDLVLQYTAFSSVLDSQVRAHMAAEMLRVLRPDGLIIWYDFWLNPSNPQTRGIRPPEIRQLFPHCQFTFRRITLAPPIARRLVPLSWTLCALLEKLRLLNSHYLCFIQRLIP